MNQRTRKRWWSAACALAVACLCSQVAAQVVVVRVEPDAESVCRQIESQLDAWPIVKDPGYYAEASREGLDPTSEDALLRLIPPLHARLAVVPLSADANGASIDVRDGVSGASLSVVQVPRVHGQMDWSPLRDEISQRLDSTPAAKAEGPVAAADGGEYPALNVRMSGGFGIGSRSLSWPVSGETWSVESGAFPAFELGSSFHVAVAETFALGLDFSYQTSVAARIEETHLAGATEELGIRSNQLAAMFAFVIGGRSFSITPALGYATRGLRPAVHHLLTPSYSLAGPQARLGARIGFSDAFSVRIAPELQYVLVGEALAKLGVASSGLAVGGELAIELAVSDQISFELSGRIAHAWMNTTSSTTATDTARFAMARLVWQP